MLVGIQSLVVDGGQLSPDHVRFLTYTTRYNEDYWLSLEELEKHYERAEVDAQRNNEGKEYQITTKNLTRLVLRETSHAGKIRIDGQELRVKSAPRIALEKSSSGCRVARSGTPAGLRKVHGLQGPIDDALERSGQSAGSMRNSSALPRIVDDKDLTSADIAKYNVVLFGDPGSNRWIAKMNGKLPVTWTRETVSMGEFPRPGLSQPVEPFALCRLEYRTDH